MAPFITVLALCFAIAGLVMVCFYAPCLWDHAVSVKSEARSRRQRRRRGQGTDLATVTADAAALRDTDQRRGIANPLIPPDYTEEDELAEERGGQPVMAAVLAHQRQQRCGRRQHRSCYMVSAGQLRIEGEPPPAYSAPQWCRQPEPADSAEQSVPSWQQLDAALWLLQQTGWRPPAAAAAAAAADDPPPEYTEAVRPTAPEEDGAPTSGHHHQDLHPPEDGAPTSVHHHHQQDLQPPEDGAPTSVHHHHQQDLQPPETEQPTLSQRPLTPRQFQQRWERLGAAAAAAALHHLPPAYPAADPLGRPVSCQYDNGCPTVSPLGEVSTSHTRQ